MEDHGETTTAGDDDDDDDDGGTATDLIIFGVDAPVADEDDDNFSFD